MVECFVDRLARRTRTLTHWRLLVVVFLDERDGYWTGACIGAQRSRNRRYFDRGKNGVDAEHITYFALTF